MARTVGGTRGAAAGRLIAPAMVVRTALVLLASFVALTCVGCAELLGPRNARRAGLIVDPPPPPTPEPLPADVDLHPVIFAYRESLRPFLGRAELEALEQLDWAGTARGDSERLRFLAADRAVRRVLPLVLDAEGSDVLDAHAARLRALPPLLNRDTDVLARIAVIEAMIALERQRRGDLPREPSRMEPPAPAPEGSADASATDPLTDALARLPRERSYDVDAGGEAELAEALAEYATEYARVHGVSAIYGAAAAAAAADMVDVAFLVGRAMQIGVGRERVFEEALALAGDMCGAARRREQLPRLHTDEPPPITDDRAPRR